MYSRRLDILLWYRLLSKSSTDDFFPPILCPESFQLTAEAKRQESVQFLDCIQLVYLSKSIAGTVHLQKQSAVEAIQKYVFASKMGFQITHKAATCEHTCWRNAHLRLAGYPPVDAGLSVCRRTHSIQPQGSVIAGWDWAWNRLILFTCPELQLTDTHTNAGRSARVKLQRYTLQVQYKQLGTIILRHNVWRGEAKIGGEGKKGKITKEKDENKRIRRIYKKGRDNDKGRALWEKGKWKRNGSRVCVNLTLRWKYRLNK